MGRILTGEQRAADKARSKAYYEANKAEVLAKCAIYRNKHAEEKSANDKAYREAHKEELREYFRDRNIRERDKIAAKKKEHYENNKELVLGRNRKYQEAHKEQITVKRKEYYEENKGWIGEKAKEWREDNKETISARRKEKYYADHELTKQKKREERERNKSKYLTRSLLRKRKIRHVIPAWDAPSIATITRLFIEDRDAATAATGIQHHLDHIVPITSNARVRLQVASGLHCKNNLQILTEKDNLAKNSFSWPDMWDYSSPTEIKELKRMRKAVQAPI